MPDRAWFLVEAAARLLNRDEREAVLGDLAEAEENGWKAAVEILGLVSRRQAALWYDWPPWLASLLVGLPGTLLLMGVSLSISCTYRRLVDHEVFDSHAAPTGHEGFPLLLCHVLLLILWSWTGGFVVGFVSRRTVWASAALSLAACFFCLARFREESVSALCLFLFLPPAILGIHHGLRIIRVKPAPAFALATLVSMLMICAWSNEAMWIVNWALLCPAWYLVMAACNPRGLFARGRG